MCQAINIDSFIQFFCFQSSHDDVDCVKDDSIMNEKMSWQVSI